MTEISRRRILVVLGGTAASAAIANAALTRGRSSPGLTRGRGQWTSFGSVSLLAWSRLALAPSAAGRHQPQHRHQHLAPAVPVPSAVHGAWTDAVVVDVEVHNGARTPIALSPGQFRVRVDDDGPTVSLYRANRSPGPMTAGSTTTLRISYLAPPQERRLSLEFEDAVAMTTVALGPLDDGRARA
jgi:hypothetical protein